MSGVNKVILVGNLGRDPEMRYTQNGSPVCNFSIATSETWKDRNTGEKRETTEWHRIVTFRNLAEICARYLRKGSKVYIEGKLRTSSYEKDGITRYTTDIIADQMTMLDSAQRSDSGGGYNNAGGGYQGNQSGSGSPGGGMNQSYEPPAYGGNSGFDDFPGPSGGGDDDIPF